MVSDGTEMKGHLECMGMEGREGGLYRLAMTDTDRRGQGGESCFRMAGHPGEPGGWRERTEGEKGQSPDRLDKLITKLPELRCHEVNQQARPLPARAGTIETQHPVDQIRPDRSHSILIYR